MLKATQLSVLAGVLAFAPSSAFAQSALHLNCTGEYHQEDVPGWVKQTWDLWIDEVKRRVWDTWTIKNQNQTNSGFPCQISSAEISCRSEVEVEHYWRVNRYTGEVWGMNGYGRNRIVYKGTCQKRTEKDRQF